MTDEQKNNHPAEHQPLFNKLEHRNSGSPWHNEAQQWSKTGRNVVQMIIDALKDLFG